MPETSSPVKVRRVRSYGASVTQVGREYAVAYAASQERAAETTRLAVAAVGQGEPGAHLMRPPDHIWVVGLPAEGQGCAAGGFRRPRPAQVVLDAANQQRHLPGHR